MRIFRDSKYGLPKVYQPTYCPDINPGLTMAQLMVTLDRVVKIVEAEGGTAQDIVKITTFVTRMSDWYPADQAQTDLFNDYFDGQNPANSLVEITALALPGLDIEIEAIAVLGCTVEAR